MSTRVEKDSNDSQQQRRPPPGRSPQPSPKEDTLLRVLRTELGGAARMHRLIKTASLVKPNPSYLTHPFTHHPSKRSLLQTPFQFYFGPQKHPTPDPSRASGKLQSLKHTAQNSTVLEVLPPSLIALLVTNTSISGPDHLDGLGLSDSA